MRFKPAHFTPEELAQALCEAVERSSDKLDALTVRTRLSPIGSYAEDFEGLADNRVNTDSSPLERSYDTPKTASR